jgi:putative CocE/NonD family hydrolase
MLTVPLARATRARTARAMVLLCVLSVPLLLVAQQLPTSPLPPSVERVRSTYTKYEYLVPMRDGVRLFTAVYVPKDDTRTYPILITRTPYNVRPYGVDAYRSSLGPSDHFEREGFIFVYQDARGRYMSEGEFKQVRPYVPDKRGPKDVDESSDTYDTIDWLLKHVPRHNGRVGMVGISQPGFHVAASLMDAHPALKAASPQAPTADYYMGDDVYHNGAFMLAANFDFYTSFRPRGATPMKTQRTVPFDYGTPDAYDFYLGLPPLAEINAKVFGGQSGYFQEIVDHPNYDQFWQIRSVWKYAKNITPAVLNVGGWFDAEDPMGPLYMYRSIAKNSPQTTNHLVMGPWSHGGWSRGAGQTLGNLSFGVKTAEFFREKIQFPFFMHYLKDAPLPADFPKAYMFATGVDEFRKRDQWPPKNVTPRTWYLGAHGTLTDAAPAAAEAAAAVTASDGNGGGLEFDEYVSDPNRPVPFVGYVVEGMTSDYATEDQRFAARRPDVLVYRGAVLDDDVTIAGPVSVKLTVSSSGTDSDFVVKLVDVYPGDFPQPDPMVAAMAAMTGQPPTAAPPPMLPEPANHVRMGGYQQLVRGEPFRAKFRGGFEKPTPLTPGAPTTITFDLPDVYHVFRRGHRMMVQVQSSWFPLIDRNPQQFMDIPKAGAADFKKATERVYHAAKQPSSITVLVEAP